jgi:ABC-type nitrate/sulfonate/bicarbonate transport system ATPase subunit
MVEIVTNNLEFGFNSSGKVLDKVNLTVNKGSICSIVGASGSGKTTLLKLISGLIRKTYYGDVLVNGRKPVEFKNKETIGFLFQEPALFPNLNVVENILLPLKLNGKEIRHNQLKEIIGIIGLEGFEKYLPRQLSGGMKTRVALAQNFIHQPRLLLLDEPFSSLDINWKIRLYNELMLLYGRYKPTIVMVTHDILEAIALSDYIYILNKEGKLIDHIKIPGETPRIEEVYFKNNYKDIYSQIAKKILEE